MRARLALVWLAIAGGALGCGGPQAEPIPTIPPRGEAAQDRSAEMVPPETTDEINRILARKRQTMAHCLAVAVDNKELPRNAAGKITLEIAIGTDGKAAEISVARATLESASLAKCVIDHVREIQFPTVPRPYQTSYTYGFEAI